MNTIDESKKKSLEQMAKNLLKSHPRTVDDVLNFLDDSSREFLLEKMEYFKKDIISD